MAQRKRDLPLSFPTLTVLVLLVVGTLVACGDDQVLVDEATVAEMAPGEFQQALVNATDSLIERHGGDEAAFAATLLALDRGYDVYQLLTGSLNGWVEADGLVTGADGSVLTPARPAEGLAQPSPDGGDSATINSGVGSTARFFRLASLSGPPLMVAASSRADSGAIVLANTFLPIPDVYLMAREAWEEQQVSLEADHGFAEKITFVFTLLAARGYGAVQILEAIVLDQVKIEMDEEACWYIAHTSGVVLRPVHPPVDILTELICPAAGEDAPTGFDPEMVKQAVEERNLGSGAGTDAESVDGEEEATADLDGIKDGLYVGEVFLTSEVSPFFEIVESTVELEVTDEGIVATVEYTQRYAPSGAREGKPICLATFRIRFSGQGPVTSPLDLILEPVEGEIIALEGECKAEDREVILGYVASWGRLTGTFNNGGFDGNLDKIKGVKAVISE